MERLAEDRQPTPGPTRRLAARTSARGWGAVIAATDLTPPGVRYGYVHPLARRMLQRALSSMGPVDGAVFRPSSPDRAVRTTDLRCGLVADALDIGGVGRVVEMLAEGLRSEGVEPVVVCPADGVRTARLRASGIEVLLAGDAATAANVLAAARLDAIQLHSAPDHLVDAALAGPAPLLPVLHNTEIHYSPDKWRSTAALFDSSATVIAVSELVRAFHVARVPATLADRIVVVANGAMPLPAVSSTVRARARAELAGTLGVSVDDDVVFLCLARYDSQKNIAGLVSAFLRARPGDIGARLVVAGDPSDWLEHRRADAIRRGHRQGSRVHLLGDSDAAALLSAADAFVLDSFFEGWPLAATEAVAAGLPIVISEAGGAAELVDRARAGSVLISNASGPAAAVSDRAARSARRRATRQPNAGELARAVQTVTATIRRDGHDSEPVPNSFDAMVAGHAALVRAAVAPRDDASSMPARTDDTPLGEAAGKWVQLG